MSRRRNTAVHSWQQLQCQPTVRLLNQGLLAPAAFFVNNQRHSCSVRSLMQRKLSFKNHIFFQRIRNWIFFKLLKKSIILYCTDQGLSIYCNDLHNDLNRAYSAAVSNICGCCCHLVEMKKYKTDFYWSQKNKRSEKSKNEKNRPENKNW